MYNQHKKKSNRDITTIIDLYQSAAKLHSSDALVELGKLYMFGDYSNNEPDIKTAVDYFNIAAEQGNSEAQYYIGLLHSLGLYDINNYYIDHAVSSLYYYISSTGDSMNSVTTLAYNAMYGYNSIESCDTSIIYYSQAAADVIQDIDNNPGSIRMIEKQRLCDDGSKRNYNAYSVSSNNNSNEEDDDIVSFYTTAANNGDIHAQMALGQLHLYGGRGFTQNPQRAVYYLQQAADSGHNYAVLLLAQLYMYGIGIQQNNDTAYTLYKQVADNNISGGYYGIGYMNLHGIGRSINLELAYNYLKQASDNNYSEAQYELGTMYFSGVYVTQDYQKAYELFSKASYQGHTHSMYYLAIMHQYGISTIQNCNVAQKLYKQVVERSNNALLLSEAYRLYNDKQYINSFMYYAMLAEQGYEVAQYNAAYLLQHKNVLYNLLYDSNQYTTEQLQYIQQQLAIKYLTYSSEQHNTDSLRQLGDYAYYGYITYNKQNNIYNNTQSDYSTAIHYYNQAIQSKTNQNAQSSFNLGYMYLYGYGVKSDLYLAKRYFDNAIQYDSIAYVPCKIMSTYVDLLIYIKETKEYIYNKVYDSTSNANTQTTTTTTTQQNTQDSIQHDTTQHTADSSATTSTTAVSNRFQIGSLRHILLYIEDIVLISLCGALAVIIYQRANPQRQNMHHNHQHND